MNLVIPIASTSKFFNVEDYGFPQPLIEIAGKPMIQHVIENLCTDLNFKKIIFIVKQDDCLKYHLDNTLNLLSPISTIVLKLRSDTQGALCSVLFAIEHIDNSDGLVIANADQIFDGGISDYLKAFTASQFDAACLTFNSVHPRWSYVRTLDDGSVIETAEKNPISRNAVAGVYFYKRGSDFIRYAMSSIKNGSAIDGKYFISPVFNEYVLGGKNVGHFQIKNSSYHTFYSPKKIEEFEKSLGLTS